MRTVVFGCDDNRVFGADHCAEMNAAFGLRAAPAVLRGAMTGQPARRLRLTDRGILRAGSYADVVVFDAATVRDRSTFEQPHQYPVGIDYVFVNGKAAVDAGRFADARSGRVLERAK